LHRCENKGFAEKGICKALKTREKEIERKRNAPFEVLGKEAQKLNVRNRGAPPTPGANA
jgi:hypothetical protein